MAATTYDVTVTLSIVRSDGQPCTGEDHPPTHVTAGYAAVPYEVAFALEKAMVTGLLDLGEQGLAQCRRGG